jgi:hypothetical protein
MRVVLHGGFQSAVLDVPLIMGVFRCNESLLALVLAERREDQKGLSHQDFRKAVFFVQPELSFGFLTQCLWLCLCYRSWHHAIFFATF